MLTIFKRNKPIVVDAFVNNESIAHYTPLVKSQEVLPDWWKKMSGKTQAQAHNGIIIEGPTIKRCDSVLNLLTRGFVIPLWSDCILETREDGAHRYSWPCDDNLPMVPHAENQTGSALAQHIHLKIINPWLVQEKDGAEFFWTSVDYHTPDTMFNYRVVPGITEFKHQHSLHINMFFPCQDSRIELSRGQPMAQLVPISDRPVDIRCHAVTDAEYKRIERVTNYASKFFGQYKANRKTNRSWSLQ